MAINYASKYSQQVDEAFHLGLLSEGVVNNDFDWVGVETVKVFSIPTATLNSYTLSGANRYGNPEELQNTAQELPVSQDKSFSFTIDRKSYDDTMYVMDAAAALRRQINEVIIPTIDTYRFSKICAEAKAEHIDSTAVTKVNAYERFLTVQEFLDDAKVPAQGRIAVISPAYYKNIKLDESFVKKGDMAQEIAINGVIGEIDGVPAIKVPTSYLPAGVNFFITNPICTPAPVKLEEYFIHENPPGISGVLVEGRVRYDAFVLTNKKDAIGVSKVTSG